MGAPLAESIWAAKLLPLPPHITLKEAKNFAASLLKGDPERVGVAKQAVKGRVDGFLPH
jgi:pyruvate dehydrogenase (quinone)